MYFGVTLAGMLGPDNGAEHSSASAMLRQIAGCVLRQLFSAPDFHEFSAGAASPIPSIRVGQKGHRDIGARCIGLQTDQNEKTRVENDKRGYRLATSRCA